MRRAASFMAIFVLLLLQLGAAPACRMAMRACCCKPAASETTLCKASCCAQPPGTKVVVRAEALADAGPRQLALPGTLLASLPPHAIAILDVADRRPPAGIGCGPPYRLRV